VLVSFHPWLARDILAERIPWEFRKRRSGHETGTQVLMYASGKVRAVVGAYTAGTVFEYQSLAALKEGVHRSEMARFGEDDVYEEWLEEIFKHLPQGWAFEICEPRAFIPRLVLGYTVDGKKVKGPHGFPVSRYGEPGPRDALGPGPRVQPLLMARPQQRSWSRR